MLFEKKSWIVRQHTSHFFLPLFYVQATPSLKKAFGEANYTNDSSAKLLQSDTVEPAKKKAKFSGPVCNAAASCDSKALYKNESTKTFFCREHYELLSKPARKSLTKVKS